MTFSGDWPDLSPTSGGRAVSLSGFAPVWVDAGGTTAVSIPLSARMLAHWQDGWQYEPGTFVLRAGSSVSQLPLQAELTLTA